MVAALNSSDYDGAAWCGGCVEVDGPGGTVVVRIVDQCPGCASGDLDLSREAFALIAELPHGRVPITWREVPCDVTGPIRYRFKPGSNPFWTAIQIRNHRYPVATVAAKLADGTWRDLPREAYNYFVDAAGLGAGPYTLRVIDDRGHVLDDTGIAFAEAAEVPGAGQAPVCE
jgi:expansin (peptidoglycan-binding protein)